jgi:amino acid transporter
VQTGPNKKQPDEADIEAEKGSWEMSNLFEGKYTEAERKEDMKVLHSMGYAQELERRMSAFSNFAVSFSIICILSGAINSLA